MKKKRFYILSLFILASLILVFQNCADSGFEANELAFLSIDCRESECRTPDDSRDEACFFNGKEIRHNVSVTAYLESESKVCKKETRTCDNGNLSGTYQYASCSNVTVGKKSCHFNGKTIPHGKSVQAYLNSNADFGESCKKQTRICKNGNLSGNYKFANCKVGKPKACLFDGRTIKHGESIRAYLHSSSTSYQNLCQATQKRVCKNGDLSGSYEFSSCTVDKPRACKFDGKTVPHGGSVKAYLHSSAPFGSKKCQKNEQRQCKDGSLSGSYDFSSCSTDAPKSCRFGGKNIPHGGKVKAYLHSSAPFESKKCQSQQTRHCKNGQLSGSYKHSSCQKNSPKACRFNGKTIPHNGAVTAYKSSSGLKGDPNACHPYSRICKNGELSNSFAKFASCKKQAPKSCLFKGETIAHDDYALAYFQPQSGAGGDCKSEQRFCKNGVLKGSAQHKSCVNTCKYGKFNMNENQIILTRMTARGCTDNNNNCRVFQPSGQFYTLDSNGNKIVTCYLVGYACSRSGFGKVDKVQISLRQRANACGNPYMSKPIRLDSLEGAWGGTPSTSHLLERNVPRGGGALWKQPYRFRGPLP